MNPVLNIIVTHSTEPWEVGQKFFDMLDIQRDADFSKIRVLLINDGIENELPSEYFENRPYEVGQHSIEKAGVSAARNEGIRLSGSEWIMFCDFDDMFTSVYSLRHILDVMPLENYDIVWTNFFAEDKTKLGRMILYLRSYNQVFIHGKLYRTSFLKANNLYFDKELIHNQDSAFNAIAFATADGKRIGELKVDCPIYSWCFNPNSVTLKKENKDKLKVSLYKRNKKVCEALHEKNLDEQYKETVARTIIEAYYTLNIDELSPELQEMMDDFKEFYSQHKDIFESLEKKKLHEIKNAAREQYIEGLREEQTRYGETISKTANEEIKVMQWLRNIKINE